MISTGQLELKTVVIEDMLNNELILSALSEFSDEDFNGNNGEEYTWEKALEQGFKSSQDYVIDVLRNSGLTQEELIRAYFNEWLGHDYYYTDYRVEITPVGTNKAVVSLVTLRD